jgi:predicted secreted protein
MATGGFRGQGTLLQRAGTTVAEIVNIDIGGAKADFDDATSMDSSGAFKEWIPTLLEAGEVSFTGIFKGSADASQAQLLSDFNNQVLQTWTIVLPGGKGTFTFSAYVAQFDVKIPHDKKVEFSSKLKITGANALA